MTRIYYEEYSGDQFNLSTLIIVGKHDILYHFV